MEGPASFVEAATLPAMSVEEATLMVATAAAETPTDYSKKHSKTQMTPVTGFAAALDCVAIDPLVVLPGERWISLHLNWAGVVNCSTRC